MIRIAHFLSSTRGSKFRQNFVKVAKANVFAKVLPLLAAPVLTRLYSPVEFGTATLFSATLGVLVAVSSWRFDWSVPNASSKPIAASLILLGFTVLIVAALAVSVTIVLGAHGTLRWSGFSILGDLAFFLPVALIGAGTASLLRGWYVRENELAAVSWSRIVESIANVGTSLLGGVAGLGALGLVLARVITAWAGAPILLKHAGLLRCKFHHTTSRRFAFAFKRYRREATWSTMVSLLNAASLLAPVLLLSQFYPIREIGWYALMTSLAISPMSIFSAAIGQSFWSEAARLARTRKIGRLRALYLRTTKRLATASLVVVAICASGPFFVGPLFGKEDWGGAGHVLVALTPMLVGAIIFSPTNHLIVLSRQSTQMFADAGRLALVIVAILVSQYAALEFVFAVALTALASFCGHFGLFLLHLRAHSDCVSDVDGAM